MQFWYSEVSNSAKIRNRYNQVPHLTQDNRKLFIITLSITAKLFTLFVFAQMYHFRLDLSSFKQIFLLTSNYLETNTAVVMKVDCTYEPSLFAFAILADSIIISKKADSDISPFQSNGSFHKATDYYVRMIQCTYWGVTGYNFKKKLSYSFEDRFCLSMMKCHIMRHIIWTFTVCQSTRLGVSGLRSINHN